MRCSFNELAKRAPLFFKGMPIPLERSLVMRVRAISPRTALIMKFCQTFLAASFSRAVLDSLHNLAQLWLRWMCLFNLSIFSDVYIHLVKNGIVLDFLAVF